MKKNISITTENIILAIVCLCTIILLIIVFKNNFNKNKNTVLITDVTSNSNSNSKDYSNPALKHSTKSVDGEQQFSKDEQWKSQPSKCFDCEKQMAHSQCGNKMVTNVTKQKLL